MKISVDLSSWTVGLKPANEITAVLFDVALKTKTKLEEFGVSKYIEVIKIGMLPKSNTPSRFTEGSHVWTCILNIHGQKHEVKLIRMGAGSTLLWEDIGSEPDSLLYASGNGFEDRAAEEFFDTIVSEAASITEKILLEIQLTCERFEVRTD